MGGRRKGGVRWRDMGERSGKKETDGELQWSGGCWDLLIKVSIWPSCASTQDQHSAVEAQH